MTTQPTERSRGIADVTLSADGKAQAEWLGKDLAKLDHKGIDLIYASPLWRTYKTARILQRYAGGTVVVVPQLITWSYGAQEGHPAKYTEKVLLKYAQKKPRVPVPGFGTVSGAPGDAFDVWKNVFFKQGLFPILRVVEQHPELVIAIVLHSRDIYAFDGLIRNGMPRSLAIDFHDMKEEAHEPGEVAKVVKKPGGLWDTTWLDPKDPAEDLGRDKPEGLLIRHAATWWNEGV